jgi:hypothetical protein
MAPPESLEEIMAFSTVDVKKKTMPGSSCAMKVGRLCCTGLTYRGTPNKIETLPFLRSPKRKVPRAVAKTVTKTSSKQ